MENNVKTPFVRFMVGYCIGFGPLFGSFLVAQAMLLTFKLQEVSPDNYAVAFGGIVALGALAGLIGNPIGGYISDKTNNHFGRRRTWILIGSIISSLCLLLVGRTDTVLQIAVLFTCGFFFMNFALVSYIALFTEQIDEAKRGRAAAFTGFALPVAMIVSTIVLILTRELSLETQWTIVALFALVGPIISLFLIKEGKIEFPKADQKNAKRGSLRKVYPSPRKYPAFTWAMISKSVFVVGLSGSVFLSMMLIERNGLTEEQAMFQVGIICIASEVAAFSSSLLSGIWSDKIQRRRLFLYIGSVLTASGLIIYGLFPTFGALLIGTMLIYSGASCFYTVSSAINPKVLPDRENAAKDLGILNISNVLPRVIVSAVFPMLVLSFGWEIYYVISAIIVLMGIFAIRNLPDFHE